MAREAIFIGYRREDTADVAGRIYDALAARFGRDRMFKDVDNLRPGADFGEYIKSLLPRCRVALILIGPSWVEAKDEDGRPRLEDPNDWVRVEVEIALATPGVDVVPVLVNGARMPRSEQLPPSLHPLLRRHAAVIRRDPDFHDDIARLGSALRASVQTGILDLASLGGDRKPKAAGDDRRSGLPGWLAPLAIAAIAAVGLVAWHPWQALTPSAAAPLPASEASTTTSQQNSMGIPTTTSAPNPGEAPRLTQETKDAEEQNAWLAARTAPFNGSHDPLTDYVSHYPNGRYVEVARRLLSGGTETAQASTPVSTASISQRCGPNSINGVVYFEWDRSSLPPEALQTIDGIVARARELNFRSIAVVGHNDTDGSARNSIAVSERRSAAVRDALIARGISAGVIETYGAGETDLAMPTRDGIREPLNRRASIIVCT